MARSSLSSLCALLLCAMAACAALPPVLGRQVRTDVGEVTLLSSAALVAATTSTAVAQQRALRSAITNASESPVSFTLTTDIVLTAPLPAVQFGAKVSIIGRCKDANGKARSCVIDGAGKYSMFFGEFACDILLERLVIQNVFGNVHVGACSFSARYVVFRNNVGPRGSILDARESSPIQGSPDMFFCCDFVNNTALFGDGGVFNVGKDPVGGPTMTFTNCTFRNNRALSGTGGVIYAEGNTMIFRNVVFEGNSAVSGGAIVTTATTLTAINTAFKANTATNGRGGAIVFTGNWGVGTYKFCSSTFRSNIASPSRYSSSNNIIFLTGRKSGSVGFCPGPAPGGIQAPKIIKLVQNCTGCSGCDGDCYGRGKCMLDQLYAYPSCRCNSFYTNESSCTECQQGYTSKSQCRQCSNAYYHPKSKPVTCALCPGFSQVLESNYMINAINNVTVATGPLQCQKFCNATQQSFNGTENPYSYCNMWVYTAPRVGAPAVCAGKCFMLSQSESCGVNPVKRIASYGITYQYLEPDYGYCDD